MYTSKFRIWDRHITSCEKLARNFMTRYLRKFPSIRMTHTYCTSPTFSTYNAKVDHAWTSQHGMAADADDINIHHRQCLAPRHAKSPIMIVVCQWIVWTGHATGRKAPHTLKYNNSNGRGIRRMATKTTTTTTTTCCFSSDIVNN